MKSKEKFNKYWLSGWLAIGASVAFAGSSKMDNFPLWINMQIFELVVYLIFAIGFLLAWKGAKLATKNDEII